MSRQSRSPAAFPYEDGVFRAAVARGIVTLTFDHPAKAAQFVRRCNHYRALLRQIEAEAGRAPISAYDHLVVRRPRDAEPPTVVIEPQGKLFTGVCDSNGMFFELSAVTGTGTEPVGYELSRQLAEEERLLAEFLGPQGSPRATTPGLGLNLPKDASDA